MVPFLPRYLLFLGWLTGFLLAADEVPSAEPLVPAPRDGVLVLRNGEVLRGKISEVGQRYYVALADGEIRVKRDDVEMACRDVDEAYRRKQQVLDPQQVEGHLELAEWCLKNGLNGYAARELAAAMAVDPRHPMLALLERRLKLATTQPASDAGRLQARPSRPDADLERQIGKLPEGSFSTFVNSVQPLLLNRCAAAGCHGPGSASRFALERIGPGRFSRRLTQRNLTEALEWIDRRQPDQSPLLVVPSAPHGKSPALLSDREGTHYQQLARWVRQVLSQPDSQRLPGQVGGKEPLLQTAPLDDSAAQGRDWPPRAADGRPADDEPSPVEKPQRATQNDGLAPPVDPFDPEVFNRRYGPSASPRRD